MRRLSHAPDSKQLLATSRLDRSCATISVMLRDQRLRRDQPPCALDEIRQRAGIDGREPHKNPRIVPIVIGDVKDLAVRLHQNLTVQQVRPKNQTFPALMQACQQLATHLERRCPVRCGVLDSRKCSRSEAHLFKRDCRTLCHSNWVASKQSRRLRRRKTAIHEPSSVCLI
jgi:hypothetical protein